MVRDLEGQDALTRAGHFTIDSQDRLVTPDGWPVLGQGGEITVPSDANRIRIDERGRIYAERNNGGGIDLAFVDQLRVVEVENTDNLIARNGQYYNAPGQNITDSQRFSVNQGYLEDANVDSVTEMVKMIDIQRRFDAAAKALRSQNQVGQGFSEIMHRA